MVLCTLVSVVRQTLSQKDLSKLPWLPQFRDGKLSINQLIIIVVLMVVVILLLLIATAVPFIDSHTRILFVATKGFKNSKLLRVGGYVKVYKGVYFPLQIHKLLPDEFLMIQNKG